MRHESSLGRDDEEARRQGEIVEEGVAPAVAATLQQTAQTPAVRLPGEVYRVHLELPASMGD